LSFAPDTTDSAGKRILYIDDEAPMVFLVTRELESRGFTVRGTVSVEEGISLFQSDPWAFDLVITDFHMPRMNGARAVEELLRARPDVPVVVVSGHVTDQMRSATERVGAKALLDKPDTIEALCDGIGDLFVRLSTAV
jgi:CheY-like chemotaxis protein